MWRNGNVGCRSLALSVTRNLLSAQSTIFRLLFRIQNGIICDEVMRFRVPLFVFSFVYLFLLSLSTWHSSPLSLRWCSSDIYKVFEDGKNQCLHQIHSVQSEKRKKKSERKTSLSLSLSFTPVVGGHHTSYGMLTISVNVNVAIVTFPPRRVPVPRQRQVYIFSSRPFIIVVIMYSVPFRFVSMLTMRTSCGYCSYSTHDAA